MDKTEVCHCHSLTGTKYTDVRYPKHTFMLILNSKINQITCLVHSVGAQYATTFLVVEAAEHAKNKYKKWPREGIILYLVIN